MANKSKWQVRKERKQQERKDMRYYEKREREKVRRWLENKLMEQAEAKLNMLRSKP